LYEAGWDKKICVVLSRRIGVVTLASRLSQEIPRAVGYRIRFDDKTNDETRIVYITDGVLMKEVQKDPLLREYSVIIFDDAHERTLNMDILIGLSKKYFIYRVLQKRPELKIIVTSATLESEMYLEYFSDNKVQAISIEGHLYPVDIYYLSEPCSNYIEKAVETTKAIHRSQPAGDILVFLTGQEDISLFISEFSNDSDIEVLPLHSSLPTELQLKVFGSKGKRKVIASTNISETAVTIEGILYVIDSCFCKYKTFTNGIECLGTYPISKSQAIQRAGRAGRVRPGKCYRLCTQSSFNSLPDTTFPEIQRSNLSFPILYLKNLEIQNISSFPFISMPSKNNISHGLEILYNLGAIDDTSELTQDLGKVLVEFPIDIKLAVILLKSCTESFRCSKEMLEIVAILSVQGVFSGRYNENIISTKRKLGAKEGDHISLLNIFQNFLKISSINERNRFCHDYRLNIRALQRACKIKDQLKNILNRLKLPVISCECDVESLLRCLVTGLFCNAAQREPNGVYRISGSSEEFYIHPSSILCTLKPQWLVFTEVIQLDKMYLVDASEIDADWLYELAPNYYTDTRNTKIHLRHKKIAGDDPN
jgi:ATP-dependent RNA helicase DDX35